MSPPCRPAIRRWPTRRWRPTRPVALRAATPHAGGRRAVPRPPPVWPPPTSRPAGPWLRRWRRRPLPGRSTPPRHGVRSHHVPVGTRDDPAGRAEDGGPGSGQRLLMGRQGPLALLVGVGQGESRRFLLSPPDAENGVQGKVVSLHTGTASGISSAASTSASAVQASAAWVISAMSWHRNSSICSFCRTARSTSALEPVM